MRPGAGNGPGTFLWAGANGADMRAFMGRYGPVLQAALGLAVAMAAGADMVGKPARLVQVVALVAAVFAAGLGVGMALGERKARRTARTGDAR